MTSQPTASFVPLTALPAPAGSREYRVATLNKNGHTNGHANGNGNGNGNGAGKPPAFHSLEQLRPAAHPGAETKPCEPRVTV